MPQSYITSKYQTETFDFRKFIHDLECEHLGLHSLSRVPNIAPPHCSQYSLKDFSCLGHSGEVSVTEDKKGIKYSKAIWWEKLTPYIDTRELKNVEKEMENFVDYIKGDKIEQICHIKRIKDESTPFNCAPTL